MRLLTRRPTRLTAGQASRSVMAAGDPIGAFGESTTGSGSGSGSRSGGGGRTTTTPFSATAVRFGRQRPVSTPRPLVSETTGSAPVGPPVSVGPPVAMVSATATPAVPAAPAARVTPTLTREAGALSAPVAATQSKSMADIYGVFLSDDEDIDGGDGASGGVLLPSAPPTQSRHISTLRRRRRRRVGVATPSPIKRPRVVLKDTAAAVSPKESLHGDPDCLVLSVHLMSGGRRARAAAAAAAAEEDVPAVSEDSPSDSDDRGVGGGAAAAGGVSARLQHRRRAPDASPATSRAWWTPRVPSQGDSVGDEDAFNEVLGSGRAAQETARRRRLRLATPPPTASIAPVDPADGGEGGGCAARGRRLTRIRPAATSAAVAPNPARRLRFGEGSDASGGDESDAMDGGSGGGGSSDGDGGSGGDGGDGGETDTSRGRDNWRRAPTAARAAPMRLTFSLLQPTAGGDSSEEEGGNPLAACHPRSPSPPPPLTSILGGDRATERSDQLSASATAGQPSPPPTGMAWLYTRLSRGGGSPPLRQARQRAGTLIPALDGAADPLAVSSVARPAAAAVDSPSLPELSPSPGGTIDARAVVVGTTATRGRRHVLPLPPDQWTWRGRRMTPAERAAVEFLTTGRVRSGGALPPGIDCTAPIAVTVAAARITLRRRDLRLLRGERWLNDEIMNAYVALLNERNRRRVATAAAAATAATATAAASPTLADSCPPPPPVPPPLRVYCFNTFFYLRLTQGPDRFDYDGVARWTVKAGVDAAATDLLLVPVHVGACHWVLVSLDVRSRQVTYLDPLHAADSGGVTATLSRWLAAEVAARHGGTPTEAAIGVPAAWTVTANTVEGVAAPRQADAGSCGVYVLAMAERLERGAPLAFGQRDIRLLRKQMVLDLHDGKLV